MNAEEEYTQIRTKLWTGRTAKAMKAITAPAPVSADDAPAALARAVAMLLMVHIPSCEGRHTSGLFHFEIDKCVFRLGQREDVILHALARLEEDGFLMFAPDCEWVFVASVAGIQHPGGFKGGDKQIKGFQKHIDSCPSPRLREAARAKLGASHLGMTESSTVMPVSELPQISVRTVVETPSKGQPETAPPFEESAEKGLPLPRVEAKPAKTADPLQETRDKRQETRDLTTNKQGAGEPDARPPDRLPEPSRHRAVPARESTRPIATCPPTLAEWLELEPEAAIRVLDRDSDRGPMEPALVEHLAALRQADVIAGEWANSGVGVVSGDPTEAVRRAAWILAYRVQPRIPIVDVPNSLRILARHALRLRDRKTGDPIGHKLLAVWGGRIGESMRNGGFPIGADVVVPRNLRAAMDAERPNQSHHGPRQEVDLEANARALEEAFGEPT